MMTTRTTDIDDDIDDDDIEAHAHNVDLENDIGSGGCANKKRYLKSMKKIPRIRYSDYY